MIDDFVLLADRRWKVAAADRLVRAVLADIGLEVAEAKSGIVHVREGFEFLGFQFQQRFLRPRPQALASFEDRVRFLTRRKRPVSIQRVIDELNPLIRGRGNYFAMGHVAELFDDLDRWIRTRLWSKVFRRYTVRCSNRKMPNRVFRERGLVSLVELRRARLSPGLGAALGEPDAIVPHVRCGGSLAATPGSYPLPAPPGVSSVEFRAGGPGPVHARVGDSGIR